MIIMKSRAMDKTLFITKEEHEASGLSQFEPGIETHAKSNTVKDCTLPQCSQTASDSSSVESIPYIRVGVDYFKIITKLDRFGINRTMLKPWKKDEIRQDHGKDYLNIIPKFDDFCIVPDNFNYLPVHNNCYNLFSEFRHKGLPGKWDWTKILLNHVFGEQVELGIRYLQVLYLHPDRMLPILVLVSKERQTGKTTFLNWLIMIFGDNMVVVSPEDLVSSFNHIYATSNIVAVEETLIEKSITVEKIKALSTGKYLTVNQKFVSQVTLPFFGKIIMTSNNEEKFARIEDEEIRFFVRKLGKPTFTNHNIENDLVDEIPAFLDYLSKLPPVDFSVGRVPFTTDELSNNFLAAVKRESKSGLYKDLQELFIDLFENLPNTTTEVYANPVDIKEKWFRNNTKIDTQYIRSVLKNEFGLIPLKNIRYNPLGEMGILSKTGTPFEFTAKMFGIEKQTEYGNQGKDSP